MRRDVTFSDATNSCVILASSMDHVPEYMQHWCGTNISTDLSLWTLAAVSSVNYSNSAQSLKTVAFKEKWQIGGLHTDRNCVFFSTCCKYAQDIFLPFPHNSLQRGYSIAALPL